MRTANELADWQKYLTRPEIRLLKRLAKSLAPGPVIVNIGAGAGTSTLAFLEERPDCLVISIDLLTNESEVTTNEHLRLKEIAEKDAERVIRIWGDSVQTGRAWRWPVDMVFVDGDHSAKGIQGDVDAWLGHIRADGIIAFHDYTSPHWPAVKECIDRMMGGRELIAWQDTVIAYWAQP